MEKMDILVRLMSIKLVIILSYGGFNTQMKELLETLMIQSG